MSRFYGTLRGSAKTTATRCGHSDISASVQSWNGSVTTRLWYSDSGELMVDVGIVKGQSSSSARCVFSWTLKELEMRLMEEGY